MFTSEVYGILFLILSYFSSYFRNIQISVRVKEELLKPIHDHMTICDKTKKKHVSKNTKKSKKCEPTINTHIM